MSPRNSSPTFGQLYLAHFRSRGALLLADATFMVLVFLPPAVVSFWLKAMVVSDVSPAFLHVAGTIDGVWLVLAVAVICLDSAGKLIMLSASSWLDKQKKP